MPAPATDPSPPGPRWRHAPATIALHWLSVAVVAVAFAFGWWRDALDDDAPRRAMLAVHQDAGMLVLALLAARLIVRLRVGPRDGHADEGSAFLRWTAAAAHLALYGFLLAMPLLGWAFASAHGRPPVLLGWRLPSIADVDPDLSDTLQTWHADLAWVFLGLVALHAAAAVWHHFLRRDRVLLSMLPVRRADRR